MTLCFPQVSTGHKVPILPLAVFAPRRHVTGIGLPFGTRCATDFVDTSGEPQAEHKWECMCRMWSHVWKSGVRNKNVEALATAALVQALREAQEARTLQEVAAAAGVPQKEIGRSLKALMDTLRLRQPVNSTSIAGHMPRFCSILQVLPLLHFVQYCLLSTTRILPTVCGVQSTHAPAYQLHLHSRALAMLLLRS